MTARAGSADIGRIQTNARIVLRLAYFGLGFKETALTHLQRIQPMPVRLESVFETIMYEYAKLIADRAVEERESLAPAERTSNDYWSFVALTFKKLKDGRISWSSVLRENKQLVQSSQCCAYCASSKSLQWEHIVPRSRNGPDTIDNMVLSCAACNREKAARNPILSMVSGPFRLLGTICSH